MFVYQLEDKTQDENFLSRKLIQCKAVLSLEMSSQINPGSRIVVQLSNRSKYMGIVERSELKRREEHAEGHLFIIRQ